MKEGSASITESTGISNRLSSTNFNTLNTKYLT